MSRWSNWSRGSKRGLSLGDFLSEGPVDQLRTGNPTGNGTLQPADRAKQLGLQSDGKGGYIDPKSGQVVARTVNNELVFYSSGPTGGAVSDGSGGAAMASPSTAWQDPITGMMITPPSKAETPNEIAAVPDAVPAVAPAGYNEFMQGRKQQQYVDDFQAREQQKMMAQMPQMPQAAPETDAGMAMQPADPAMAPQPGMPMEDYNPADLFKRSGGMGPPSFSELRDKIKASQQVSNVGPGDIPPGGSNDPLPIPPAPGRPTGGRMTLAQFQAARRPKAGKKKQAAFDQMMDPKNAPGVDPDEYDRQAASVDDPAVDRALNMTDPAMQDFNDSLSQQRIARMAHLENQLENMREYAKKDTTGAQENIDAMVMMHALRNGNHRDNPELFTKIMAQFPGMEQKPDWYDNFMGYGDAIREKLGLGESEIDEDWAVERTANRDPLSFIDKEDQHSFMQDAWDMIGDKNRKETYGSQLDSWNPADLTFLRKSHRKQAEAGLKKIAEEFKDTPELLPGIMEAYMTRLEDSGILHRASMKQADTEKGVPVGTKDVNKGEMRDFDLEYDDDDMPRILGSNFGENRPATSLSIDDIKKDGGLGFDGHSFTMSPNFNIGDKEDRYMIENKRGSLINDPFEIREMVERNPEAVPHKGIKKGTANANARGGSVPVNELNDLITDITGDDINFRVGIRPQTKKDGTPGKGFEAADFTEEDEEYTANLIQELQDYADDTGNPMFDLPTKYMGKDVSPQEFVKEAFNLANTKAGNEKYETGLRTKLRQLKIMKAMMEAHKKGPRDLAKFLIKLKYLAGKQSVDGGEISKGGYTKYQ